MKRIHTMLLSAVVVALPAVALAAPKIAFYRDAPVKSIHAGQTQDDVRSLVGNPSSTRTVAGETRYYYRVEDNFGIPAFLVVTFDSDGYVMTKGEIRSMN